MSSFSRQQYRFFCQGLHLASAMDMCPPGKWPVLQNVRSYQQGTIQSRDGLTLLTGTGFSGNAIHTIYRLRDPTPFASVPALYFFGAAGSLFAGPIGGPYNSIDSGYSGSPLTSVALQPFGSPHPWLYVADTSRMWKFNVNGLSYPIGIASPPAAPLIDMYTIGINLITSFNAGLAGYTSVGADAGALAASPALRVNTTITDVLPDPASTIPGNISIVPASMANISEGMMLLLNAIDLIQVAQVTIAIAPTTIAAIIYDVGTTGLCTIQPAASLGTGQLETPSLADERANLVQQPLPTLDPRFANNRLIQFARNTGLKVPGDRKTSSDAFAPRSSSARRIRQLDFPVHCLVRLNGTELVRIISVTTGADGIQSFRAFTVGTFSAGQTITGVAGFRAWTAAAVAQTLTDATVRNTITPTVIPPATTGQSIAGIISGAVPQNLAQVTVGATPRPLLPEDDIHLAIRVDDLTKVQTVRIYFDVDTTTNDFTRNYYFFEWRASDLIEAIQNTNTAQVNPVLAAAQTQVINAAIEAQSRITQYRLGDSGETPDVFGTTAAPQRVESISDSQPLGLGNNQWLDLHCKISQLLHVGTDPSRTLHDVQKVEVLIAIDSATPVIVDYDTLYASGGFSPDVGQVGTGYQYRYSYRSSITGAVSNPSPLAQTGVYPRRQRVIVTGAQSSDPQADLIDWWRFGGALTTWTYVGTTLNIASPLFNDDYGDQAIDGGKTIEYDNFQPWPSTDLPRVGTVNVAGNTLRWVSGDLFNVNWAEGSVIIVNQRVYTLLLRPVSTTLLFLTQSAGVGTAVNFTVPSATLVSQVFPVLFGGAIGGVIFTFGLGDTRNPGSIVWTKPNNPDVASDANVIQVTSPSEPLINGCMYDGLPYAFSPDNCYLIEPEFSSPNQFRALVTPCGRGLWSRQAMCPTPYGIAFLAKDGVGVTRNGGIAQMITDKDLYPLFPHDGRPGVVVNGFFPPDMAVTAKQRLSFCDGYLYFDYQDTNGALRTMSYRFVDDSWWPDLYTPGITARFAELGDAAHEMLLGGSNGNGFRLSGILDNATAIACLATRVENQGDARAQKLYRDCMLELESGGSTNITLSMGLTNNTIVETPVVIAATTGRKAYYTNIRPLTMDGYGTNLQMGLAWSPVSSSLPGPIFYVYDIGLQVEPELSTNWLSGPTTHGLPGFQQVPLAILAYRSSGTVSFSVIIDGVTYTYALPSTGGQYLKKMFRLQAIKGMTFQYGFLAPAQAAFQLFDIDCEVWVQPWGTGGGYQKRKPFSGAGVGRSGIPVEAS